MKKILLLTLLLNSFILAGKINIAVAANVSYAIDDLIKEFNKTNPDTKVLVTLGSSGKLVAQIKNGAPYNIFMSANMKYPNNLYEEKKASTKPEIYAQGSLAIFSASKKDFSKAINLIKDEKIGKIAIANPKTAPYGKATIQALENANLLDIIKSKLVYAESISQTVSYTITATDLGFIAKASLFSPKMSAYKKNINWIDLDTKLYNPINQGIVIINNAKENEEVKAFYDFILSNRAKNIFEKFGYLVP